MTRKPGIGRASNLCIGASAKVIGKTKLGENSVTRLDCQDELNCTDMLQRSAQNVYEPRP